MSGLVNVTLATASPTVDVELDDITVEVTVPSTVAVDATVTETGPAGPGLPTGGTTGQVAAKASNTNYDVHWVDQASGGGDMLAANNLSDLTDDSAARANLGLGTAATHATTDYDAVGAAAAAQSAAIAASQPVDSDLTAIAALSTTSYGRGLLTLADAAAARAAIGAGTGGGDMVSTNNLSELTNTTTARSNLGLGTAATHATTDYDASGAAAAAQAASQPVDSDLTAIAALTTTAYGRAFLGLADAAAGRAALGLGTAATHATGDYDAAGAAAAAQSASQPLDGDLTTLAGLTATTDNFIISVASAWASRTPAQARTTLGLVIGTDVQAHDTDLDTIAGLTATTDNIIQSSGSAWASRTPAQVKTALGLTVGTDVQAHDTDLDTLAGLTATTDNMIQSVSSAWASRTPAQVKSALAIANTDVSGLGTMSTVSNTAASVPIVDSGNVITATNVETAFQELAVLIASLLTYEPTFARISSTSTAKNNSTTLSDVTGLVVAVAASSTYVIEGFFVYQSSTTADIKFGFTVPSGAAGNFGVLGAGLSASTIDNTMRTRDGANSWASTEVAAGIGATSMLARLTGFLVVSTTAGNLQVQMAQNTLDATDTTIRAGSFLTARRVA